MFRLHKHKSDRFGDKLNFNFSNIQALQVPKGWEKLFVSIISVETGRTICKSGKASVRNGNCRWTETLSESILIPQHDSLKDIEECLFKFVVSMGSARSGILGEATINLVKHMSSTTSSLVSLPLKKCNHGTILQVKIQCLTPRPNTRDEQSKNTNSHTKDLNDDYDSENKSDASDSVFNGSVGSASGNHLDTTFHPGELCSRETSFSASGSRHSFDSADGSFSEIYSPRNNLSGLTSNLIGRQDSSGSQDSSPYVSTSVDICRSSQSFNLKVSGSGNHAQNQSEHLDQFSRPVTTPPSNTSDSPNELLEASESTTEEIHTEARMQEQNARKLKSDFEKLQKKFSYQSKHQEYIERELSESQKQCYELKQENEVLRNALEESVVKQMRTANLKFQEQDIDNMYNELQDEIKFQNKENSNLTLQLQKTQESNIGLVSILQELEETIEKQKMEIANLSNLKSQSKDNEKYENKCEESEEIGSGEHPREGLCEEFGSEDKRNIEIELRNLQESQRSFESTIRSLEKSLWEKNHEIETERDLNSKALLHCAAEWKDKLAAKENEIIVLEAKLFSSHITHDFDHITYEDESDCNMMKEIEALKQKVQELERDCNELTDENLELLLKLKDSKKYLPTSDSSFSFSINEGIDNVPAITSEVSEQESLNRQMEEEQKKNHTVTEELSTDHLVMPFDDKACHLHAELSKDNVRAGEPESDIAEQQVLESYHIKGTAVKQHFADCMEFKIYESHVAAQMSRMLSELHEQLILSVANIKKQQSFPCSDSSEISGSTEIIQNFEGILNSFSQLKNLYDTNTCRDESLCSLEEVNTRAIKVVDIQNKLVGTTSTGNVICTSSKALESLHIEMVSEVTDLNGELLDKNSDPDELKVNNSQKEDKPFALDNSQRKLDTQIPNLQREKMKLDENIPIILQEGNLTSISLDSSPSDIKMCHRSMDSEASANEILVRKSIEIENANHELEGHLSELEDENIRLSERVCGMEAQLRYLTEERESCRLKLHNSESHAINLQDQIRRLEIDIEAQKVGMKQKVQIMHNKWLEAQEECEYLKKSNPKLQSVAESVIEECSFLQKTNRDLKNQNKDLHKQSIVMEAELKESQNALSHILKEFTTLEENFSSFLEEVPLKEKALSSELDALFHENKSHKEKVGLEESRLNKMYLEKQAEIEKLQTEVKNLAEQMYATDYEKQKIASEAVLEVLHLRVDKAVLQASLEEVQGKLRSSERLLEILQMETEQEALSLKRELAASKQNEEFLMADHEKLIGFLEEVKTNENKLKTSVRKYDSKLKASEFERLQLEEEICMLKVHLQNMIPLQDEILALKRTLVEANFENERLQASLQILSGDYEELKDQKSSLVQKFSDMEQSLSELEKCRHVKVALEEKVLRLEGDLTAKEALSSQEAELRNEFARVRRENIQFQRKIKFLEDEKEECLNRAHALEEGMKQEIVSQNQSESSGTIHLPHPESEAIDVIHDELKISQKDKKCYCKCQSSEVTEIDPYSRIKLLENDLAEALEANDMYKNQLKSLLSKETDNPLDEAEKGCEHKGSSIEMELRELLKSYSHMSLKYAEAETEREELSMMLKAVNMENS